MKIEQTSVNAITIIFDGKEFLFMGEYEEFDSQHLEDVFNQILDEHHTKI